MYYNWFYITKFDEDTKELKYIGEKKSLRESARLINRIENNKMKK